MCPRPNADEWLLHANYLRHNYADSVPISNNDRDGEDQTLTGVNLKSYMGAGTDHEFTVQS